MESTRSLHERFDVNGQSNAYYQSSELPVVKKNLDMSCSYSMDDCCSTLENFIFPPPPLLQLPLGEATPQKCLDGKDGRSSSDDADSNSDSSQSDNYPILGSNSISLKPSRSSMFKFRGYFNDGSPVNNILSILPPIGVFWDIENCQVPKGRSAVVIAQAIRDKFFQGYRETEFLVVCDVKKENSQVIQELNDAQVNLIHVSSQSKNAADDKLRQAMRRFADIHGPPAAIMLISGDINFSSDLCDLRHRKKIHVILLHNDLCSQSLILCANEHHNYSKLVETLPLRGSENLQNNNPVEVLVTNLPIGYDPAKIRNKLKRLSENCGGRVGIITDQTTTIRFSSMEFATRAQKRMNKERVFGNCVFVSTPYNVTDDQDLNKISVGKKNNICRNFDHIVPNQKMYHCPNNENFLTVPEYPINDQRNFLPYNRPASYYQNGATVHCRNDQRSGNYTVPHTNQENIAHPNNLPPWYHWNSSNVNVNYAMEGMNKPGRQVLAACDGNSKCLPQDPYVMAQPGKFDRFWQNESNLMAGAQCQQPNSYTEMQKNGLPQITILKRNGAVPVNPLDMNKRYFHPICTNQATINQATQTNGPVELHITNLDQCMDTAELHKCLFNAFAEFTTVLNLSVYVQSDGNYAASVKVPSHQDAQFVISKLHRRKIGFKRIMISNAHNGSAHNISLIRSQTVSLLRDVPGNQLPLIKFRELYEKRYLVSPSASDLSKLKDVCTISEEAIGRIISLNPELRNSPSPLLSFNNDNVTSTEQPYCKTHWKPTRMNFEKGWAELEVMSLPNVKINMTVFSKNLHRLVASHNNYLLLTSFCDCYEMEFGKLLFDDNGVPLEHLVTCVSGLELVVNNSTGIKYITASTKVNNDDRKSEGSHSIQDGSCISPSLVNNLALFSRELVDLLKTFPHCTMSFNRFIPAYHHHFGRQCRVADYGYTKLIDLMDALPNVVQVIGEGNRRMLTLAHKAQIRRFTSDLLRVLKSLASKQTTIGEFPSLFEKTIGRPFDPVDYGLCYLEDLLSQISENTVVIHPASSANGADTVNEPADTVIAIPKREQTAEEIERTKIFANEVVELLSHAPQCSMLFNKFIPAYHHHYGHQCKVADFGFTKLIELFEAIPDVVKIEDDTEGGDRKVTLREEVKLKVLGDQLVTLVMSRRPNELSLVNLNSVFLWQYGYSLKPSAYGFNSLQELIENLNFAVKLVDTPAGPVLQAVDKNQLKFLSLKTKRVLIERSAIGQMFFKDFSKAFVSMFGESIELQVLEKELTDTVTVIRNNSTADAIIKLTPLEIFARDVYLLMISCEGKLPLNSFENAYLRMYGTAVQPAVYGYQTISALLQAIPQTVVIRGKPPKRIILLNTELTSAGFRLPKSLTANNNRYSSSYLPKENIARYPAGDSFNDFENQYLMRHEFENDGTFFKPNCNSTAYQANPRNETMPLVMLPDLTLHPDTYTASPLTSPHKSLHNTIMFAEHMLHAPTSRIETPSSVRLPYPVYLNNAYNNTNALNGSQFHDCRSYSNSVNTSPAQDNVAAVMPKSCEVNPDDQPTSESIASSTDSFSDGTVSSSNKRKVRLAAQFHGFSES
ncbi:meiosis regulator and mRNA stability factor 1-like isoform X2 [Planococcus citri]|uniref:meiosis regulator and mRNA stability factor 1-like isoform X2 n=1 Tax=Planococcus citri TaxID=170843 RepID=UPI0031F98B5F